METPNTKEATIKVGWLNKPKEGKTMYNVKTPDGVFYGVKPVMVSLFQEGATYDIKYTESSFNGRMYKTIISARLKEEAQAKASATTGKAPADDKTAERIYVCGGLNSILSNPSFNASVVDARVYIKITKALRQSWLETFGGKPSAATELDDEIPDV